MVGDCLVDFEDSAELYIDLAREEIVVTEMVETYCEFLKLIGVEPMINICTIAQCAETYLDSREWVHDCNEWRFLPQNSGRSL